jgi:spore coat protein U-like protein
MKYSNILRSALSSATVGFLALGIASTSMVAQANPATTTFGVSATVLKDCVVSATALGFGNYTGALVNASSTVTVTCTSGTTYTVGLNQGLATGALVTTRQMAITQPAGALNYSLLTGSYTGTNWGNTSGSWVSGTGNAAPQPLTVYGVIPAGQYVTPGSYTDTITATVTY